ncbi:MAG: exported protein of unknown function [Candidatus Saccharibacteria bacterium]|nr:exported protein of unknown function [Candidatus Saccharibacteria bacterium]
MSSKFKIILARGLTGLFVFAIVVAGFSAPASAAQITGRSVTISNSANGATGVTYQFDFTVPTTGTPIKSIDFQSCTTLASCGTPVGVGSSTLASQPTGVGAVSGWTVNTSTAGSLRLENNANATNPSGAQRVIFAGVTNPATTNTTYFFKITTHSNSTYSAAVDTGNVATSTAGLITVTATVDETLAFSVTTATVALGSLSTSSTASGVSTMSASTNAATGYGISVNGTTLTSGANTIAALASGTAATTNTPQFGINLVANTVPSVGSAVSGAGSGVASVANGYGTANSFKFVTGDVVASATVPTNSNTFTTSYIANINALQKPGAYSTTLTYIATANF